MNRTLIVPVMMVTMAVTAHAKKPLNVLFLTVDDMSCDSIGVFGCKVADTSPNIDRLAADRLRRCA